MSDFDITNLYQKFTELDRELKELKVVVGEIKWYQQHGTNGAVAYNAAYSSLPHQPHMPMVFIENEEEWSDQFK